MKGIVKAAVPMLVAVAFWDLFAKQAVQNALNG